MCFLVCQGRDGVRLGGGQVNSLEKVYLVEWGIDGNYIWFVFIVVIFMGLGVAKRWGKVLKSSYEGGGEGGQATKRGWGGISYGEVDPSRHHAYVSFQIFVKN